ncbi:MAG: RdgB/HAM1 family non-canonical purine NTP pyrophosphatase, partial [Acidobacteria bacterium]|nr:RdgB/HAM1 family non-canonical purine NTP pyrophosphatase [Acidobacteriota bacterium]
ELKFLDDFDLEIAPPEENGNSFEENSLIKAKYYSNFFKESLVASEDSGLMVDALNGAPGIFSARINSLKRDSEKVEFILKMMKEIPCEKRGAKFVSVVALVSPKDKDMFFRGEVFGRISLEAKGYNGFGYDPIFIPEGETRTFAEMAEEEKNAVSHRKMALLKLKEHLIGRNF